MNFLNNICHSLFALYFVLPTILFCYAHNKSLYGFLIINICVFVVLQAYKVHHKIKTIVSLKIVNSVFILTNLYILITCLNPESKFNAEILTFDYLNPIKYLPKTISSSTSLVGIAYYCGLYIIILNISYLFSIINKVAPSKLLKLHQYFKYIIFYISLYAVVGIIEKAFGINLISNVLERGKFTDSDYSFCLFGYRSNYCAYIVLLLPYICTYTRYINYSNRRLGLIYTLCIGIIFASVVFANSRAGILLCFFYILFFTWKFISKKITLGFLLFIYLVFTIFYADNSRFKFSRRNIEYNTISLVNNTYSFQFVAKNRCNSPCQISLITDCLKPKWRKFHVELAYLPNNTIRFGYKDYSTNDSRSTALRCFAGNNSLRVTFFNEGIQIRISDGKGKQYHYNLECEINDQFTSQIVVFPRLIKQNAIVIENKKFKVVQEKHDINMPNAPTQFSFDWDSKYDKFRQVLHDRLELYKLTLQAIIDRPLYGYGTHTWHLFFLINKPPFSEWEYWVHNDFLEIIYELGIIGILPILCGSCYFLNGINRFRFSKATLNSNIMSNLGILIFSLVDFPLKVFGITVLLISLNACFYCYFVAITKDHTTYKI